MKKKSFQNTKNNIYSIESERRLSSQSIENLSNKPELLKAYLDASLTNTFSELLFRLTYERYSEDKAEELWGQIIQHRKDLAQKLGRDLGLLVSTLDFLSNVLGLLNSPKIIEDLKLEEVAEIATKDPLTGLYSRGVFDFSLKKLVNENKIAHKQLSLLLLDIDNFKSVNDQFGHQIGDQVLKDIGQFILKKIRISDLPARYGGEELGIILPETALEEAGVIANRLRLYIQEYFASKLTLEPQITVSIGVSSLQVLSTVSMRELIFQADHALYQAKSKGKNRVEIMELK